MSEEKFEEFIKRAAQSYHVPPARTPRDEMWDAIQAKRSAGPRVVYGGGISLPRQRRFGTRVWMGAAAAGLMLMAAGIGIGRWSASSSPRVATTNAGRSTAETSRAQFPTSAEPSVTAPSARGGVLEAEESTVAPSAGPRGARPHSGREPQTANHFRSVETRSSSSDVASNNAISSAPTSAYQLATERHLSDAEALLTSFRTRTSADRQMDAQLAKWARDLLTNTRLLLDSPVADDAQRRPLLEDLELVLVQIVQLSPGSTPQDRELIEKTLQQEHVLTRLRTAIPAGAQRGS